MEKFESLFLTEFLGLKEFLPSKGSDCLMGLNPTETGISITQISEARHEHPLESRLLLVINFSLVFASLKAGAVACPTICLFFSFAIRHSPFAICLSCHSLQPRSPFQDGPECPGNDSLSLLA